MHSVNPWLSIPLADYEGHMDAAQQLAALSALFARALEICRPDSVCILGIAGGNGLEHLPRGAMTRVVGVDINPHYLQEVQGRFGAAADADARLTLELHCVDLARDELRIAPVALVHAALFFEHAGVERGLDHAIALVSPGGWLSVVLQLPESSQAAVTLTRFPSMQALAADFSFVDVSEFRSDLERREFHVHHEEVRTLSTGKRFWFGILAAQRTR